MMFRRRGKKKSDLFVDSSNHSINNSKHNAKYNLSRSLPELGRVRSQSFTAQKPMKGILRITSVEDSLHSVYGTVGGRRHSRRSQSSLPDFDSSVRSSQSDDIIVRTGGGAMSRRQSVLFKAIEIREYERTVGDNPSCSSGPPVSISWEYYPQVMTLPLDDYESYRPNRRSSHEMILSRELRDNMLRMEWDVSRAEIAAAIRDTIKIKNQRRQTVQNLNKDKVEELFEGASKKIFRSLMFKSSTTQELDVLNQQYNAVQELRQQEKKLAQQEQQQLGNGTQSIGSGKGFTDSLVVVGLNIDDTDVNEDFDDDDDDNNERKEDFLGTPGADQSKTNKKPILIVEDDDDMAMFITVESMKNGHSNGNTGVSTTAIGTTAGIPDRTDREQQQCKGENSSQDGSINLNNSRHRVVYEISVTDSKPNTNTTAVATTTFGMEKINTGITTEI